MNRLILADNLAIFRAGAARVLALEDDMRIVAQCEDAEKFFASIEMFRGGILLVASSLQRSGGYRGRHRSCNGGNIGQHVADRDVWRARRAGHAYGCCQS